MEKFNIQVPPPLEPKLQLLLKKSEKLNASLGLGEEYNFFKHPFTASKNIQSLELGKVSKKIKILYDKVLSHSNALQPFFQAEIAEGYGESDQDKKLLEELTNSIEETTDNE